MSKQNKSSRISELDKSKKKNVIIGGIILAFSLGIIINYFNQKKIYNDNIAKNIFIENIDVSKMTKEQATQAVGSNYAPKGINLSYEGKKYEILPTDIDLKYNVEETVEEAYNYTKTDNYFENLKRYFNLKDNKKSIEIKPSYDEAKLSERIQNISNDINVDTVDAKVYISNSGGIASSPSNIGKELNISSTKEGIINNIENKDSNEIKLEVNIKEPNIKTEDAKSVNTLLAQFTTKFSTNASSRVNNIKTAASRISDILLMPGEQFSYNNLTGVRNKANGYKDAPVIVNGKLEDAVGGGVCQVSTTLYNSALSSGMQLTAVTNHSLASSYVPIGRDAMVNDGGTDFRFKNPYSHPVYIKNVVENGTVTSRIYGNESDKKDRYKSRYF